MPEPLWVNPTEALNELYDVMLALSEHQRAWNINRLILEGYGYHVSIGAFSTPIVGGGDGTIIDLDQPEGVISVAAGYTMIPIRVSVQCQMPLMAADSDESEILVAVDTGAAWAVDGTRTAEMPFNMRDPRGGAVVAPTIGPIVAASAFTADMTRVGNADPVLDFELMRKVKIGEIAGVAANALWTDLDLLYEPLHPPIFGGPCALYLYWGGTVATTGFAQIEVAVFPSDRVNDLRL